MFKPWLILLETTNRCNARCVYCNHRYIKEFCDMDFDFYKRIVDETVKYGREIHPNGYGEPLLYPHIVDAIAYARDKGFKKIVIYTNASLLTREMSEQILDAGLTEIRFSVDACDKAGFERVSPPLKWEEVLANIECFQELKNKGGYSAKTMIRPTVTKEIYGAKLAKIRKFWESRVDKVVLVRECYWSTPAEMDEHEFSSGAGFRCPRVYSFLEVKANGNLVICSCDYLGRYVIANLHDTDFMEAFNSQKFNDIREAMETGKNYPTICHLCHEASPEALRRGELALVNVPWREKPHV